MIVRTVTVEDRVVVQGTRQSGPKKWARHHVIVIPKSWCAKTFKPEFAATWAKRRGYRYVSHDAMSVDMNAVLSGGRGRA